MLASFLNMVPEATNLPLELSILTGPSGDTALPFSCLTAAHSSSDVG